MFMFRVVYVDTSAKGIAPFHGRLNTGVASMETDVLLWFAAGWVFGGFVNGVTGFGAAMAAMPLVSQGMGMNIAVPANSLMVLVVSLYQGWRYRHSADWGRVVPVLVGAVPGALLGSFAWRVLPVQYMRPALGVFLIAYMCWGFSQKNALGTVVRRGWGYVAGFFATTFGAAFSFNGPPLAIYTSLSGWGKEASRAGLGVFSATTSLMMVAGQGLAGMHGTHTLLAMLVGIPGGLVGAYAGVRISRNMNNALYQRLLFGFIGLSGAVIFAQGMRAL